MERRESNALDRHITGNWGEDSVGEDDIKLVDVPRITLGVSIERHSKGTNWSVRVDGASDLTQLLTIADEMRKEMDKRFGTVQAVA